MRKLTIALLAALTCGISYAGDNLVKNGKFDNSDSWRKSWAKVQGTMELDKTEGYFKSAPAALKITQTDSKQYTFKRQTITVKPNTEYVFSCWMKGDDIKTPSKGGVQYWILGKGGKTFRDGSCIGAWKAAKGTFDWSKVMIAFNSGDNTSFMIMVGMINATGTVWFDDVELYEKK